MLNELLSIEQGLTASGLLVGGRHRDLQTPTAKETIRARLSQDGALAEIEILPAETTGRLWTLRNGQHNSFPFIQLKHPLLNLPKEDENWQREEAKLWKTLKDPERRHRLRELANDLGCSAAWIVKWPEAGLKKSLAERVTSLAFLRETESAAIPAAVDRFLVASEAGQKLLGQLVEKLLAEVDRDSGWLDLAHDLLTRGGPLYFDVLRGEFVREVADSRHVAALSRVLSQGAKGDRLARCALIGEIVALQDGSFPQPKLPVIGQTFLFSKNVDIPAAGRYGRYSTDAFPVGSELVERLGEALRELTAPHRRGVTWRSIPGEQPSQNDLLGAFVSGISDAAVIDFVAEEDQPAWQRASYHVRTQRVIDTIKGKIGQDFRRTPVNVCILRKVDLGNGKVIFHRATSVGELWEAATAWADSEDNLPNWLEMPVPAGRGEKASLRGPPHIAPLQLPGLTRVQYIRGGIQKQEVTGLSAADAFSLFLGDSDAHRRARLALRLAMDRYGPLLAGGAQALRKGFDDARAFDRSAALQSLTLLGVLLRKIGRGKETYMDESAFKLGQLLAVADTVHVGYCADRRAGDVPPVLLGNSVLAMAQSSPSRALAALCRRWKPYGAWAKLPATWDLGRGLRSRKDPKEVARGWHITRGASAASRAADLTRELHGHLPTVVNDVFRAELLLGYVAGLPRRENTEGSSDAIEDTETE